MKLGKIEAVGEGRDEEMDFDSHPKGIHMIEEREKQWVGLLENYGLAVRSGAFSPSRKTTEQHSSAASCPFPLMPSLYFWRLPLSLAVASKIRFDLACFGLISAGAPRFHLNFAWYFQNDLFLKITLFIYNEIYIFKCNSQIICWSYLILSNQNI